MSTVQPAPTEQNRRLRVFLCHASGDKQFVRDLYARLMADGFDPWLDEKDLLPGQRWQEEIPAAVRKSDVVIVCLSKQSVNKEGYLQREIRYALDEAEEKPEGTIFIIPARIEEVAVPRRLSEWQWADLFNNDGYERLLAALDRREQALGLCQRYAQMTPRAQTAESKADSGPAIDLQVPQCQQAAQSNTESMPVNPRRIKQEPFWRETDVPPQSGSGQTRTIAHAIPVKRYPGSRRLNLKTALYAVSIVILLAIAIVIAPNLHTSQTSQKVAESTVIPATSPTQTPSAWPTKAVKGDSGTQLSAEQMYDKGEDYYYGWGVGQDYNQARSWYLKAADTGNSDAMYSLGFLYVHSFGVRQDYGQARSWFKKAAAAGDANAMNYLGDFYEYGRGVMANYHQARIWYEKAVAGGSSDAMNNLGFLYDNGHGVIRDYQQARAWYQKAADKGESTAMYNLGSLYFDGRGVPRDYQTARYWYQKAADAGDPNAKKRLQEFPK